MSTKYLRIVSGIVAGSSLFLIMLGGFVRATGAGLSCPDWPLCYGKAVPDYMIPGVMQEVGHRYLAGIVSILTIFLAIKSFTNRKRFPVLWKFLRIALVILTSQVILGGLTIFLKLNPFIVTSHLATGSMFFLLFATIALEKNKVSEIEDPKILKFKRNTNNNTQKNMAKRIFLSLAIVTFFQVILGGFVGSSGAALACPDIPFCYNQNSETNFYSGMQHLQLTHRIFGTIIMLAVFMIAFIGKNNKIFSYKQFKMLMMVGGMFITQIGLGLANVYFRIPISITIAHLVMAELILLKLFYLYKQSSGFYVFYDKTEIHQEENMEVFSSRKKYLKFSQKR